MTPHDIQQKYFEHTGNTSCYNSNGVPDIEYLYWLENRITESGIQIL